MRRPKRWLAAAAVASVAATVGVTYSAFTAVMANGGNSIQSATVAIEDNDSNTAMLALTNAVAGASDTSCIRVTYTGSVPSRVRLYGAMTGTLAPYLSLSVTRGTDSSPSFDSCANFTPDATDYIGAGPGVIWTGLLSTFPTTYAGGIVDPTSGTPESWTTSEAHTYKFVVFPVDNNTAGGRSSTFGVSWEARNE